MQRSALSFRHPQIRDADPERSFDASVPVENFGLFAALRILGSLVNNGFQLERNPSIDSMCGSFP